MAMVPLRDAVADAHHALESGDYGLARATCQHILSNFPRYADMHRLKGEILLEQGDTDGARHCFDTALSFDPQNVLATLGLGVIAEEGLDLAGAATAFQRALEIDPSLTQLRNELVRLYSKLYGAGGRLHVSGPGLAAIYARGNQLTLARREFEQMAAQQPDRVDLMLALMEVQWRAGDMAAAEQTGDRILTRQSAAVRALYMLADIKQRQGKDAEAAEFSQRAVTVDPSAEIARALLQVRMPGSASWNLPAAPELPAFDYGAIPRSDEPMTNSLLGVASPQVEDSEWQRISNELTAIVTPLTPAAEPTLDAAMTAENALPWDLATAELALPEDVAGAGLAVSGAMGVAAAMAANTSDADPATDDQAPIDLTDQWDRATAELIAATPDSAPVHGHTDMLREIDELGMIPFAIETETLDPSALPLAEELKVAAGGPVERAEPASRPEPVVPPALPAAVVAGSPEAAAALRQLVSNWDDIDLELKAATPTDSIGDLDTLAALLAIDEVVPFRADHDATGAGLPPANIWASVDTDADEPLSTGTASLVPGFTQELQALDAEGISPFDFGVPRTAPAAPPPPRVAMPTSRQEPVPQPEPDSTWADIEAQLNAALPQTTTLGRGYTSELRALDDAGLEPFLPTGALNPSKLEARARPTSPPLAASTPDLLDDAILDRVLGLAPLTPKPLAPISELPSPAPVVNPLVTDGRSARMTPFTTVSDEPLDDVLALAALAAVVTDPPATRRPLPPPEPPTVPPVTATPPASSQASLIRPSVFGATISLSGSLFTRLSQRKQALVDSGAVVIQRSERPATASQTFAPVEIAAATIDLEPTNTLARRQLADTYAAAGQPVEAASHYRLLLRTEPDMLRELADPIRSLATAYSDEPAVARLVGDLYLRQGRYAQAMDVFRTLLTMGRHGA